MFFLAFQEYLKYVGNEDMKTLSKQEWKYYLEEYRTFCERHHLCDNVLDAYEEWMHQNI